MHHAPFSMNGSDSFSKLCTHERYETVSYRRTRLGILAITLFMFYFTMYLYFVGIVEHRVDLKLDIVKHDIIAQCELHVNIAKHFSTNKKKKI
jgi:hypothetical protein